MFDAFNNFQQWLGDSFFQLAFGKIENDQALIENNIPDILPNEMIHKIFSYLNAADLDKCKIVCKEWKILASNEVLWSAVYPKIAFGKEQWAKYFGDVGNEPPLPKDIHKILKSPCPFFTGKTIGETHMLVLIPETVDGKPLTLLSLEELVKAPKEGNYKILVSCIFYGIRS